VQYVEARVTDRDEALRGLDRLSRAVPRPASGVGGVTGDGRLLVVLHHQMEESALGTGLPGWWEELKPACTGEPRVHPAKEVTPFVHALPTQAGFAQVIRARVADRAAFERVLAADAEWLARERPEISGGMLAWHDAEHMTLVVCFRDEASARAGEAKNAESPGADIEQFMDDATYDELRHPWTLAV
jgi:hypothetical protein